MGASATPGSVSRHGPSPHGASHLGQNVLVWPGFRYGGGGRSVRSRCRVRSALDAARVLEGAGDVHRFSVAADSAAETSPRPIERGRRLPWVRRRIAGTPGSRARACGGVTLPPAGCCQGTGGVLLSLAGHRRVANKDREAKLNGQGHPWGGFGGAGDSWLRQGEHVASAPMRSSHVSLPRGRGSLYGLPW